ncbi:DUF371 domain-containing protein [Vulcanisaeta souniana]|uniref:DUF371 domain-containing protein n=1 Tax=Vulcanisaeta souniana JCM 11219 TaxID=1293586 RepID=A0ABM8BK83_9CREN|nr:DUF371 domain-containing protein [Vulcanisaeta souniana]BDR91355.1 hypothetical protein Vsou_04480 [Vulcanisaeta souniana JCM 11219]
MVRIIIDKVQAWGHINVRAGHRRTIEVTKDDYLTPRGDCIVGIKADRGLVDINPELKDIIRRDNAVVIVVFIVDEYLDLVIGMGSSKLTLGSRSKMIIRRSAYTDDSTLMIKANKAAIDLDRKLIDRLKRGAPLTMYIVGVDLEQVGATKGNGT